MKRALLVLVAACGGSDDFMPRPLGNVPDITSVTPEVIAVGGPATTLAITGDGFAADALVLWDGGVREPVRDGATLTFEVSALDIARPAIHELRVFNPSGGISGARRIDVIEPNPLPVITNISPDRAAVGSGDTTVTVSGSAFALDAVVKLDGMPLDTTYVTSQELTAVIPSAQLASQLQASVSVTNPTPGGGTSGTLAFTVEVIGAAGVVERVSVNNQGMELPAGGGSGFFEGGCISADGRYAAFLDLGTAGGDNGDLFVRDTCRGASSCTPSSTEISVTPDGMTPNYTAVGRCAASPDMRFVTFTGTNEMVPNLPSNAYVMRDTCIGAAAGCTPNTIQASAPNARNDFGLDVTDDGRYVFFVVTESLAASDTNNNADVYRYDTCRGATGCTPGSTLISATSTGAAGNGGSMRPTTSSDGRYVAFDSDATDLVAGDTNGVREVFLRDTCLGASGCTPSTIRVAIDAAGAAGGLVSEKASLDRSGRYIAFKTTSKLSPADTDGNDDIYLRDTCTNTASCTPSTTLVAASAFRPLFSGGHAISTGGRYVTYLDADPVMTFRNDVWVADTCAGATGCTPSAHLLSTGQFGLADFTSSAAPAISRDGRFALFEHRATNLVANDTNAKPDVFLAATGY